ncbi:hypothetical protein ANCCAN_01513 [Ancylostoma caninum]|uniref:Uncharacterized protein n=1 Tax=Ancylostoma caninum TaxID=29170 RepID=A0A368HA14_ANCCA|nr:hypothetical protein ANCCAN_01513 [Ancylostoma caninum]
MKKSIASLLERLRYLGDSGWKDRKPRLPNQERSYQITRMSLYFIVLFKVEKTHFSGRGSRLDFGKARVYLWKLSERIGGSCKSWLVI